MDMLRDVKVVALGLATAGLAALLSISTASAASAATASIGLTDASAALSQSSDTGWTLAKSGVVNKTNSTVTWTVSAAQGATVAGQLVVYGQMTVTNYGSGPATIGNIVVNLQTRAGNRWITRSSDVANATQDDAATSAKIVASASSENLSTFTENAASGKLLFMDASNNSIFALVPEKTIAPGATVTLLFFAGFDNNVLNLSTGSAARGEIIVTFGNASKGAGSASNIDIDGSGAIDADELLVRSVPTRIGFTVPAPAGATNAVTLSDTLADISTSGTVTFTNAVFTIGQTTGSVQLSYNGGVDGGTIRNCAHLTGTGINLETCSTQIIAPEPWETGDVITYPQEAWGDVPNGSNTASLLISNFVQVYPTSQIEIGIPGAGGHSILLTNASFVLTLLPTNGLIGPLLFDETNLPNTLSGTFGGDVIALRLNVDFSDAGVTLGAAGIPFGDLKLCGVPLLPNLNDMTVREYLGLVSTLLGGGSGIYTISQLAGLTDILTNAFVGGAVSQFALDHVVAGTCQ